MKNEIARREIESLDYYLQNHTDDYSEESHTAMMMAIQALSQEPCDDVVSREIKIGDEVYVHGYVDEIRKDIMIIRNEGGYFSGYKSEVVKELPSVTQKSGKWIITPFSVTGRHYQCSECKYIHTFTNFEYCPKCGAKMVEPQESEDKE